MPVYYSEIDPFAAAWLRKLIEAGLIANGDVDDRSIRDVQPDDLRGYSQCHFFAGIGGWSLAFRLAGLDDDFPVWTGSCPCQPFSTAGKQKGAADDRHLWPDWFRLVRERRPSIIFGEQVANAIGHGWLDAVADDLEGEGYALGAAVLPACAVGAPHRRDRLWFVADARSEQYESDRIANGGPRAEKLFSAAPDLPNADCAELRKQSRRGGRSNGESSALVGEHGSARSLADSDVDPRNERRTYIPDESARGRNADRSRIGSNVSDADDARCSQQRRAVADATKHEAVECRNWWAVEPALGRVAHGIPNRVGALRGFGNAIVPQVAAEFIVAALAVAP